MTLRPLHLLGSPVLRQHSSEVKTVDDEVRRLVEDLYETMDAARGVGLAANQVGVARATAEEGCLSIPDMYGDVTRPERVVIEALDQDGTRYRKDATGLKARAIQHEIDHLDGILFLDHLSLIRRQMLLARWRREHKDDAGHTKEVQAATARSE
jgi:peptide deformylase